MQKIRKIRKALSMTQTELAERVGVTQGAVYQWESGVSKPCADILPALAKALGCSIDDLFKEE